MDTHTAFITIVLIRDQKALKQIYLHFIYLDRNTNFWAVVQQKKTLVPEHAICSINKIIQAVAHIKY